MFLKHVSINSKTWDIYIFAVAFFSRAVQYINMFTIQIFMLLGFIESMKFLIYCDIFSYFI